MNKLKTHSYIDKKEVNNMSVFLRRFINHKKYIMICMICLMVCGFLFGFYQYHQGNVQMIDLLRYLFYLNVEDFSSHYQLYLLQNGLYIFLCTYLSSSYLGHIGLLLLFLKGMQISISLIYVYISVKMTLILWVMILIEILLEIILCLCMNMMCIHISLNVAQVTFFIEQNFNMKSLLNYKLNCIIMSLILFFISLAFRQYIIPFF